MKDKQKPQGLRLRPPTALKRASRFKLVIGELLGTRWWSLDPDGAGKATLAPHGRRPYKAAAGPK
jgi:hypothetical protein